MFSNQVDVTFIVTKLEELIEMTSTIKCGKPYHGVLNLNTNAVWFDDDNGKSFVFWVGDTCELLES